MPRQARGEYVNPNEVQILHLVNRCVRRAYLCGDDPVSGQSFEHRREWIRQRLEFLAGVFAIDCLTYTIMSNHLHLILRSRPDVAKEWSDEQVAIRWLRLFPKRRGKGWLACRSRGFRDLHDYRRQENGLAEIRLRLSDVSWWMRCTAENIARRSNREDRCTGRFWEGRYRAQMILDEASLLACAAYVDLNPIRAAMAKTPEDSKFTGAKDRIDDLGQRQTKARKTHAWERSRRRSRSGWLSPLEIDQRTDAVGADVSPVNRRASLKGFLSMSLVEYLELLDLGPVVSCDATNAARSPRIWLRFWCGWVWTPRGGVTL